GLCRILGRDRLHPQAVRHGEAFGERGKRIGYRERENRHGKERRLRRKQIPTAKYQIPKASALALDSWSLVLVIWFFVPLDRSLRMSTTTPGNPIITAASVILFRSRD